MGAPPSEAIGGARTPPGARAGGLPPPGRVSCGFACLERRWPCSSMYRLPGPGMRPIVEFAMLTSIRIPSRAFVVALALLFAAGPARAQCLISGGTSLCNGPVQLCGPDGLYEYQWTDPAGNPSYDKCLTAALPGVYSLQIFDMYGATLGPCTQLVPGPDPPP